MSAPSKRFRVSLIVQEYTNGTYRATEHGVQASGTGDTAHEAIRDYTRQVEQVEGL